MLIAPEFAYVAKLVAPTSFIQYVIGDFDVVADYVNIIIKNSSHMLFTGVGDKKSGLIVKRLEPLKMKEKGISMLLSAAGRVQCAFDLVLLKPIVDAFRMDLISIELSVDGLVKISSECQGAITSVYLANMMVDKEDVN
jgi:hypothetical protein